MSGQFPWIVGISGASGVVYARRFLQVIESKFPDQSLDIVVSEGAQRVLKEEEGVCARVGSFGEALGVEQSKRMRFHNIRDTGTPIASGSYQTAGMVVIPCSMSTLAAVACGISDNALRRAADVTLKEGRRLILVPRETPLSAIHLENMLKLSRHGAAIVPAMPGFYHRPQTIDDIVDMLVMKVLDSMGLESSLVARWGGT